MKINTLFLTVLTIITCSTLWQKIFPNEQFIQNQCLVGTKQTKDKSQNAQQWVKVVDCVICINFPIQSYQKGYITIRNGLPYTSMLRQGQYVTSDTLEKYQLYIYTYMQRQCIEYQCKDLQSSQDFYTTQAIKQSGLHLTDKIQQKIQIIWQKSLTYNNLITKNQKSQQILITLFNNIFGSFIPFPWINQQYYNSMVIKLRYSQPQAHKSIQIQKPVTKISFTTQSKSDSLILCVVVLFTLAVKLKIFIISFNITDLLTLSLSLAFINPHLFSLITLSLFCKKNIFNILSLFVYFTSLMFDISQIIIIAIIITSFLEYKSNRSVQLLSLLFFNLLLGVWIFMGIQSSVVLAPVLLWAFCYEEYSQYLKIGGNGNGGNERFMAVRKNQEKQRLQVLS